MYFTIGFAFTIFIQIDPKRFFSFKLDFLLPLQMKFISIHSNLDYLLGVFYLLEMFRYHCKEYEYFLFDLS